MKVIEDTYGDETIVYVSSCGSVMVESYLDAGDDDYYHQVMKCIHIFTAAEAKSLAFAILEAADELEVQREN